MVFDATQMSQPTAAFIKKNHLFSCKIPSLSLTFCHFGVRQVNKTRNNRLVGSYVLNKRAKFDVKYSSICGISEKLRFSCWGILF